MSVSWNPWHGCRKISEGCRNCYVYRQDSRHDKDSREVRQTAMFDRPVRRSRDGRFKVPAGEMVYTCFTSDFLLEEADAWRAEAWEMMRIRHDLRFLFFTKRIDRLAAVLPPDWGDGYENVVIGCTVENQAMADYRLLLFLATPVRHRLIVCAPLLGPLDIARYLSPAVEEVSAGGESGNEARPCDYAWVLGLREQCVAADISFCFHVVITETKKRRKKAGDIVCQRFRLFGQFFPSFSRVLAPCKHDDGTLQRDFVRVCRPFRGTMTVRPPGPGCSRESVARVSRR